MSNRKLFRGALSACALLACSPALAQATSDTMTTDARPHGFWITTPAPEFKAAPGKQISIPLSVINDTLSPRRASLALDGLPKGWTWTLKHGAMEVEATMVNPDATEALTLDLKAPADAKSGTYALDLKAAYDQGTTDLPLSVTLADLPAANPTLKPELPALRGGAKTDFQYKLTLENPGLEEQLFTLDAAVPAGFEVSFKKGYGSDEITGVPVKAGGTETVTLHVKPNGSVSAGDYPVKVTATAGGKTAEADLGLRITGSPELALNGPQERLSGSAVAGQETSFPFTVVNRGSAPAQAIRMDATPPHDWKVAFDPAQLPALDPGQKETVNVSVTPGAQAIAGDYMLNIRADAPGASQDAKFRVTVNTSTVWGMAGIGVIGTALLVLAMAVLRYGRR
ncbi:NEW3 domain-containing protein [Zhengella mangrovi]|nr:NEW3 domain-containing protein [Zhengella mangrovi]